MSKKNVIILSPSDGFKQLYKEIFANKAEKDFEVAHVQTVQEGAQAVGALFSKRQELDVVIVKLGVQENRSDSGLDFLVQVRQKYNLVFGVVHSQTAVENPHSRYACFQSGANMVTNNAEDLLHVLQIISRNHYSGSYVCPFCGMSKLSEDELWEHAPTYHSNATNKQLRTYMCPICNAKDPRPMVHLYNKHGPPGRGEMHSEDKEKPPKLYAFALVVVQRKDGRFLLVQEFANSGFWLPGGRVDCSESLEVAAIRETKEEGGIDIRLTGVLRMEFGPGEEYCRLRVIFLGEPIDDSQEAKSIPNYESVGAAWVKPEQMKGLPLRGGEPAEWIPYVVKKGPVYPLSVLALEGAPVTLPK